MQLNEPKKYDKQNNKTSVSSRAGQSEYRHAHCSHFRGGNLCMKFNQSNKSKNKQKAKAILTRLLVAYTSP